MRLTVLEFAERYRIKEADASKLLRRAALDDRLEVSYDDSHKAMYTGSSERYLELSREYREGMPQRRPSKPRILQQRMTNPTTPRTPRTPAQKSAIRKYLMANYASTPWPEILEATGCSKATVYHFACEMGLKRPAHRTKDQQFTIGATRVVKEHVAPSKSLKPVLNSTVDHKNHPYTGAELLPFTGRTGALDAYALPSLALGKRLYRDGRAEAA